MILGLGIDIVRAQRIEKLFRKYGERFLHHILTENEIAHTPEKRKTEYIAGRFAAKEAVVKAMNAAVGIRDVEILSDTGGRPYVANEKELLSKAGIESAKLHISITHDGDVAAGFALLEKI